MMLSVFPQKDLEGCAVMDTSHNKRTCSNTAGVWGKRSERKEEHILLSLLPPSTF